MEYGLNAPTLALFALGFIITETLLSGVFKYPETVQQTLMISVASGAVFASVAWIAAGGFFSYHPGNSVVFFSTWVAGIAYTFVSQAVPPRRWQFFRWIMGVMFVFQQIIFAILFANS